MLFLLANWRWLIPTAAAVALGIMLGITRIELVDLRAAVDRQKAEAAQLLAERTAQVLDRERAAAELNAQLENTRHDADVATATADGRVRAALAGVRQQRCRAGGTGAVSAGTGPGGAQDTAPGGDGGLSAQIDADHANCTLSANVLAGFVRECNAFALSLKP